MGTDSDKLFARYRETGDPASLAKVFDLTAHKLLLLAIHLTGDELGAEDLVQSTFVKLIEKAGQYDPSRTFLPWASTILTNEARKAWHRSRRERDGSCNPREVPEDPQRLATEAETVEVLSQAIDRLSESYRAVVRLKVVHGMKPGEIARVLSIRPELARTRLSRGLKLLREMLPAGLAGSALLLMSGRGLATVRRTILDQAERARPPKASLTVPLVAAWLAIPVAILALAWWGRSRVAEREIGLSSAETVRDSLLLSSYGESSEEVRRTSASTPSTDTRENIEAPHVQIEPARGMWWLSGFVRSSEFGPLEGAAVQVTVLHGCDSTPLPRVHTDARGRYRVEVDALRKLDDLGLLGASLLVRASAEAHLPGPVELLEEMPGTTAGPARFDQDFLLRPGRSLSADLRAPDGSPEPGPTMARLVARSPTRASAWEHFEEGEELRLPVAGRGPWRLEVLSSTGVLFTELPTLPMSESLGALQLEEHGVVQGRLVVPGGHPVPHTNFSLHRAETDGSHVERPTWQKGTLLLATAARGRSDEDGRFRITGLAEGRYRLRLEYSLLSPVEAVLETNSPAADILLDGQALTIRTVDEHGRRLPGLALNATWELDGEHHAEKLDINDLGGVFELLVPFGSRWRFTSGTWSVTFEPREHRAITSQPVAEIEIPVRQQDRLGELRLELLDEQGRELEEFELHAHHLDSDHHLAPISGRELRERRLPEGSYVASLICPAEAQDPGVAFSNARTHFEISAGEVTQLEVRAERSGRIEILFDEARGLVAASPLYVEREGVDGWLHVCGFVQEDEGHWRVPATFDLAEPSRPIAVLPPGNHRIRVRSGERTTEPAECRVRVGELTRARMCFAPH